MRSPLSSHYPRFRQWWRPATRASLTARRLQTYLKPSFIVSHVQRTHDLHFNSRACPHLPSNRVETTPRHQLLVHGLQCNFLSHNTFESADVTHLHSIVRMAWGYLDQWDPSYRRDCCAWCRQLAIRRICACFALTPRSCFQLTLRSTLSLSHTTWRIIASLSAFMAWWYPFHIHF